MSPTMRKPVYLESAPQCVLIVQSVSCPVWLANYLRISMQVGTEIYSEGNQHFVDCLLCCAQNSHTKSITFHVFHIFTFFLYRKVQFKCYLLPKTGEDRGRWENRSDFQFSHWKHEKTQKYYIYKHIYIREDLEVCSSKDQSPLSCNFKYHFNFPEELYTDL